MKKWTGMYDETNLHTAGKNVDEIIKIYLREHGLKDGIIKVTIEFS